MKVTEGKEGGDQGGRARGREGEMPDDRWIEKKLIRALVCVTVLQMVKIVSQTLEPG